MQFLVFIFKFSNFFKSILIYFIRLLDLLVYYYLCTLLMTLILYELICVLNVLGHVNFWSWFLMRKGFLFSLWILLRFLVILSIGKFCNSKFLGVFLGRHPNRRNSWAWLLWILLWDHKLIDYWSMICWVVLRNLIVLSCRKATHLVLWIAFITSFRYCSNSINLDLGSPLFAPLLTIHLVVLLNSLISTWV